MEQKILELTEELMKIKDELSKITEKKTELEKNKKSKEYELWNAMDDDNIQSFKHDNYGTVYRSHRVWCKVIDPEKAYQFLREHGAYDDVMKLEPKTGRLNTLIKQEFLDKTGVVPEDAIGIQVTVSPMVGNRAAKRTGGDEFGIRPEGL